MEPQTPGQAIIVSTGRCGSTLLSDLIAEQPDTLSIQEFFMSVEPWIGDRGLLSGAAYWSHLSSPKPELATLVRIGIVPAEVAYPADGRWAGRLTDLPRILVATLPKISPDPDRLFDTLAERVPEFPAQPLPQHHRMFLDLLTSLTGRRRWVERSGGSSHVARCLLTDFPDAKIIYLTRDREDTARSMSRHPSFQLLQLSVESLGRYGVDLFEDGADQRVPEEFRRFLPGRLTAETLREHGRDLRRYRNLCAFLTSEAEQAIADARPRELLTMTYEDLVDDPLTQLGRLGRFLDFDDWEPWARRVAGAVVAPPRRQEPAALGG
ncbi:sulfotransferase domain-containing protein [Micromonospora sp. HM5-17]|jgi:hypothetical protein|uniref:sulfotransferase domain-containing protein n=1 Tax=Micromonospora sp. HM5-17 TaxID=2487710 RepID=UPI000F4ADD11|nr:sulfotransferase domain-containing protein [Micromonospora sp. HM5-17]ROT28163.1 hypothetical protein EF879_21340 [Micromonospora sp. HM5-17]